jgi:carboxylesterase
MPAADDTYKIKGGRVGILLIHGLFGAPVEMRYVAGGLARAGYTVHCAKLAGHCGTEAELRSSTWQDWYRSAAAALDEIRNTCDTVILAGQSTGAVLSLLLSANRPDDVHAIALYSPTLWLNGWQVPWYARFLKLIRFKAAGNFISLPDLYPHGIKDPRTRALVRKVCFDCDNSHYGTRRRPGGAVVEHRWLVNAVKRIVKSITQPALIIHSREDDYADLNNATYLQRNLAGAVDVVVLDDSYHIVTLDRQRHVVTERTLDFVARVTAKHSRRPNIIDMNCFETRQSTG